jgi:GDP-L-fucose synthase
MTRVLLTGSTGFVGQNVLPLLKQHYDVRTLRSAPDVDLRRQVDVKEVLSRIRPNIIVHLAGKVGGIGANRENPGRFMYDNLIMGTNLIHEAMTHDVGKFIMLGTVCAYPKHTPVPFKESDLWNGYPEETNAPYAIAKKTLMRMLEAYHEQYGLNGVNLVPVNMYGPHDHFNLTSSHVIPALILKVQNAIEREDRSITLWGDGLASREFLFARDCAEAIHLAIENNPGPEPINIGTGVETTISDLVNEICQLMGYTGEVIYDTTKPNGQPRRCLDTSRAMERLNFTAKTNLSVGLKETINWFRQQG